MGIEILVIVIKFMWVFITIFGGYLIDKHIKDKRRDKIKELTKDKQYLQAQIDRLMLEFCPEEMTKEQIENWENAQVGSIHQCDHSLATRENLYIMTGDQLDKFSQLLSGGWHPRHSGESDKDFRKRLFDIMLNLPRWKENQNIPPFTEYVKSR